METLEILDKYRKIIGGILNCNSENIKFYNDGNKEEIGTFDYDKQCVSENWTLGTYEVYQIVDNYDKPRLISSFKLYQLQHCCAFMVSCNAEIMEEYRNKRIGTILNNLRQDIGRQLGYTAILCTDIEQNVNQRKLLKTNGWKDIYSIINKRTNNRVYLSIINI
jgi:hypothetical protein